MHKVEVKLACLRSTRGDGLHAHVRDHHLTWSFNEGPQVIDRGVGRYVEPSTTGASEAAGAGAASWLVEQIEWVAW